MDRNKKGRYFEDVIGCSPTKNEFFSPSIKTFLVWMGLCLLIRPVSSFLVDFIKPDHRFFWNLDVKEYAVYTFMALLPTLAFLFFAHHHKRLSKRFGIFTLGGIVITQFYFYFALVGFLEVAVFMLIVLYALGLITLGLGARWSAHR